MRALQTPDKYHWTPHPAPIPPTYPMATDDGHNYVRPCNQKYTLQLCSESSALSTKRTAPSLAAQHLLRQLGCFRQNLLQLERHTTRRTHRRPTAHTRTSPMHIPAKSTPINCSPAREYRGPNPSPANHTTSAPLRRNANRPEWATSPAVFTAAATGDAEVSARSLTTPLPKLST